MTSTNDVSDNYKYWDNIQPCSIVVNRRSGSVDTEAIVEIETARIVTQRNNEASIGGVLIQSNNIIWLIPVALYSEKIEVGDAIRDADNVDYKVLGVDLVRAGISKSHWRVLTIEHEAD